MKILRLHPTHTPIELGVIMEELRLRHATFHEISDLKGIDLGPRSIVALGEQFMGLHGEEGDEHVHSKYVMELHQGQLRFAKGASWDWEADVAVVELPPKPPGAKERR